MDKSRPRILLVDDDPRILRAFRGVLVRVHRWAADESANAKIAPAANSKSNANRDAEDALFDIVAAQSGEEGVAVVAQAVEESNRFAVAFVDMQMPPGWDGLKTIEELWKLDPDLQVVICTGYSKHSWSEIQTRLGTTDQLLILKKPFDLAEVSQLAVALTQKWRLAQQSIVREKEMEQLVRERTGHLELATNVANLGYWTFDFATNELNWSRRMYELFELPETYSPTLQGFVELFREEESVTVEKAIETAMARGHSVDFSAAASNRSGSNILRHFQNSVICQLDANGQKSALFGITQDVTKQETALVAVRHAASHDSLTDLPNRSAFRNRFESILRRSIGASSKAALILLDIDDFKSVNDTLGHPFGDELLRQFSNRLIECVGESDFVARLGGDEFSIIQTNVSDQSDINALLETIMQSMSHPITIDGRRVHVRICAGATLAPKDGSDVEQLLQRADLALYRAKRDGTGQYRFFEPHMHVDMVRRRQTEEELRQSIATGNFELFYQPIVVAKSRRIASFEALVRWPTENGQRLPADFIPVAEDSGLIIPLGEWVLDQACADAASWPKEIKVAVNVSPIQFQCGDFAETVANKLSRYGIEGNRLELEITETIFLRDSKKNLKTLHELRKMGVRIVMDDFGIGYSALSYLRSFPFDCLKLDRSFVVDLMERDDSRAIVSAISALGSNLGIKTTAEGVETVEQLERLIEEGYTHVQGYLLGKPSPISEWSPETMSHAIQLFKSA